MAGDEHTLDGSDVGRLTIARTELLDLRRVLEFAAGIGERADVYCDDAREGGVAVHPGLAFALEFNAQGRLGVRRGSELTWLGTVHAETDLRVHAPFRVGHAVTTQGQLVARRQGRSGVFNCERYRMVDDTGRLLAEMDFVILLRGGKLAGGDRDIAPAPAKPTAPAASPILLREMSVPREMLHQYTACSGIHAAIHTDRKLARQAGFADVILHGSATKSMALSAVVERYFDGDPTRVTRLYGQLRNVVPAETAMRIEAMGQRDEAGLRHVFFRVLNDQGLPAVANGFVSGRLAS